MSKIIFSFAILSVTFFWSAYVYANPTPHSSELAQKICDIRNMFCGGGGITVIVISIVTIGLMVFNGRMHWTVLVMILAGFAIFVGADVFVSNLSGDDSITECECF